MDARDTDAILDEYLTIVEHRPSLIEQARQQRDQQLVALSQHEELMLKLQTTAANRWADPRYDAPDPRMH